MIHNLLKRIIALPDFVYNYYAFMRWKPICVGCKPKINGKIYMVSDKGAITFGKNVHINSNLKSNPIGGSSRTILFAEPGAKIVIGNNVGMSNSAIHAAKSVVIGDNVMIGGDCKIYDTDFHSVFYNERIKNIGTRTAPVVIGRGVFLGTGSMILKGVHIGDESVIAAGSVVTKDIPDKELWGGTGRIYKKTQISMKCISIFICIPSLIIQSYQREGNNFEFKKYCEEAIFV